MRAGRIAGWIRLAITEVHRQLHPEEIRKELAELQGRVGVDPLYRLPLALLYALLEATPSGRGHVGSHIEVAEVAQGRLKLRRGRPSALLIEFGKPELVGPDDRTLLQSVIVPAEAVHVLVRVADTDHHRHHVCEVGVSAHSEALIPLDALELLEERIAHRACNLEVLQVLETQVNLIGLGPDLGFLRRAPGRDLQRNLVLVVVVHEVRSQAHEGGQVARLQGLVGPRRLGVHEHAQALVHAHVEVDVAVGRPRITVLQAADLQLQRLLVQLGLVGRGHIDLPDDARGRDVVDRLTVAVLLDVHRADGELRVGRVVRLDLLRSGQGLVVLPPFTADQLEPRETQGHGLAPPGHEDPHETDAPEIADAADARFEIPDRHLELEPLHLTGLPVGHGLVGHEHVGEVVAADVRLVEVSGAERDAVLEVTLDGAQGQVLVEVLRVGEGRGGNGISLGLRRARVALVAIEEPVTLEHVLLVGLRHGVTEIPEIVGRGVLTDGLVSFRLQRPLQAIEPIGEEFLLLLRVQSVESDVLLGVVSGGVVERVDDVESGRVGHHTPGGLHRGRRLVR